MYPQYHLNIIMYLELLLSVVVRPELMARNSFVHYLKKKKILSYMPDNTTTYHVPVQFVTEYIIIFLFIPFKADFL